MSLPLTRNTTYTGSSQVKSVDLNDFQDQIITLHAGAGILQIPGSAFHPSFSTSHPFSITAALLGNLDNSGATSFYCPILLPAGTRLTTVELYLETGVTAGDRFFSLKSRVPLTNTSSETVVDFIGPYTTTGTQHTMTLAAAPFTLATTVNYTLDASLQYLDEIAGARIVYDRLP